MREIDPIEFIASGEQAQHCGQPAQPVDSGIQECNRCDAYAMPDETTGALAWKNPS